MTTIPRFEVRVGHCVLAVTALAATLAAAPLWRVRARAEVHTGVVRLGDLVRPQPALEADLAQLVLSAAPQPGVPLRWSRTQLTARLRSAGVPVDDFEIPARIEIERHAEPVPLAAVMQALRASLHRSISAGDVRFTPPLTTATEPAVKVIRVMPDTVHQRLEVLCRAQNDPQLLPFAVSVRVPEAALARAARKRWVQQTVAEAQVPALAKPMLVKPGRMARLVISNPGFALTTLVQPLQAGREGEHIRVRSVATHAVLVVQVTGRDQVASLPNSLATWTAGGTHGSR